MRNSPHSYIVHHFQQLRRYRHSCTSHIPIYEKDQAALISFHLSEDGLIPDRKPRSSYRVHSIDTPEELPLVLGKLNPLTVMGLDSLLGTVLSTQRDTSRA